MSPGFNATRTRLFPDLLFLVIFFEKKTARKIANENKDELFLPGHQIL